MQKKKENTKYVKVRIDSELWQQLKTQCVIAGVPLWDAVAKGCEIMLFRLECQNNPKTVAETTPTKQTVPVVPDGMITSE